MLNGMYKSNLISAIFGRRMYESRLLLLGVSLLVVSSGCSTSTYRVTPPATITVPGAIKAVDSYCKSMAIGWRGDLSSIGADANGFTFIDNQRAEAIRETSYTITYKAHTAHVRYSDITDVEVCKEAHLWVTLLTLGYVEPTVPSRTIIHIAGGEQYTFRQEREAPWNRSEPAIKKAETLANALEFLKQQNHK